MVTKDDLIYRQVFTLRDGTRVLLRPLLATDRQALLDLYLPIPFEERRFMRHNVNDPAVVTGWVENLDYDKVFPLVAVVSDRIVGEGTLHFRDGLARHRAELRIFLAKDFRRRGLGNKMTQALIDHAKRRGLFMIEVYIVSDNVDLAKAMQKAGFVPMCTLENYYILPDGEMRDVYHLTLHLRSSDDEF